MFNSSSRGNRETSSTPLPPPPAQSTAKRGMFSVIGQDVTITGNVSATADLHIDGRVDGDVHCGNLVQGSESRITGNVRAQSARLAGAIEGKVSVNNLVVERAARITGDVEYETIAIENGAAIDGRLKHGAPQVQATLVATPTQPAPSVSVLPTASPFDEQAA
ncbi:bactofilin family protein [Sphingomonas sp. GlSt437]|uniref:bactofilin family protein n=1 Tax=Sphingomonas sp. GlSt437 TaxID=3389970 RepID=UPI003A8497A2